jgi:quercetin dioxygenase-like cupin family protein
MGGFVAREEDREFVKVEWGRTKKIIGPENTGSQFLRVNTTEYAAGIAHSMHRHPNQEEVIFVLDGEGISRTRDGDKPIRAGSFVFIPADTDHETINLQKDKPMKAIIMKSPPEEGKGR